MAATRSDPHAWLDPYIEGQRCNVEVIERVTGLTFAEVADVCSVPEPEQDLALEAIARRRTG